MHSHDHSPHHHHSHAHGSGQASRRALSLALVLNGGFLIIEAALGWWTGSLALLSDAAHMAGDVAALSLALGAAMLATRDPSPSRSFGLVRAETLGAFLNAVAMIVVCALILREAVERLSGSPQLVAPLPVAVAGGIGLAINLGSAWALWRADHEDLNIRGALVHMISDALGSVGAVLAAGLIWAGFPAADSIVGIGIAALVLWVTWGVLRDSTRILLQFAPRGLSVDDISAALRQQPGVVDVHELHVWSVDGRSAVLSGHLVLEPGADPLEARRRAAGDLERRFGVHHSTLQVEVDDTRRCAEAPCRLASRRASA